MVERTPLFNIVTQVVLFLGLLVGAGALRDRRDRRHPRSPHRQPGADAARARPRFPGERRRGLGARRSRPQDRQQRHLRRRRRARQGLHRRRSRPSRWSSSAIAAASLIFWLIFITLMLPLEVRIVPTYAVAANVLSPYQTLLDLTGITWLIEQADRLSHRAAMGAAQHLYRPDPAADRHGDRHLPLSPVLPDHPGRAGRGGQDGWRRARSASSGTC